MSDIIDISVAISEERIEISTTEVGNLEINAIPTVVEVNIITSTQINPLSYDLSDFTNNSSNPFVRYDSLIGFVPASRLITINGITQDLSVDRSWVITASTSWGSITGTLSSQTDLQAALNAKQDTLVSGTNIKTINSSSLLGSGDISVQSTLISGTNIKTIEGQSILGSGNIDLTKSDVGLSNVDNTSDLNKPISTATQTALNSKFDIPTGTSAQYLDGTGAPTAFPTFASADKMVTVGRNATGSTLYKGTIVYILGSTGNRPNFVKAQANSEATSAGTFGVIESDIPNNSDGNCVTIGTVDNLDTRTTATHPFTSDTLADGDTIYLSPTTAGYITNVKPSAPNHLVYIGKVVRTSPTNGTIVYRIQNGYELNEIHDVQIISVANNDLIQYDSATSLWKNKSLSAAGIQSALSGTGFIKISGTTISYDNSTYYLASNPNGYTNNLGTVTNVSALTLGTTGTDLSSSIATGTTTPVITLNVPTASATNRGALSSADWSTFNAKQDTLISGTSIKTIEGQSLLGSGNIDLTKSDVGLSNVDNTSDLNKPISTAAQTALNAKENTITAGTTSQYYRGDKTFQTLDKTAVGLSNVDNTSDANKPISTATQTALNAKQDTLVSGTSIKTVNSTSLLGSGDVTVQPTLVSGTNIKTVNSTSLLGSGDVSVGVTSVTGTSPISSSGGATPAISIATANTTTTGALTSTDWNTFNGKQNALTLTTTGTSGAATLVGSTLNIPQYSGGGGGGGTIYKLTSQTLTAASWVLSGSYYQYTFSNVNITTNTRVDFTPDNSSYNEVTTCGMTTQVTVTSGSCTFYSLFPPQTNITGEVTIFPTV